jgi:dTDP-4-amino-4,6-dideoxygalactose transaminase
MQREVPPTAGLPLTWMDVSGLAREPALDVALARFLGVKAAGITSSGTAALIVTLAALKQRSRRRVVVIPAYTCPLVPLAVAHVGLHVKVCDVSAGGFDLDTDGLAGACDADTLAVVPTHLGGMVANLEPVMEIAARAGALVVEDAAQALGAKWRGRPVGTVGEVGCYSLSRGKGLTIYEGGFWVARDDDLRAAMTRAGDDLMPTRAGIELLRIVELVGYRLCYNPIGLDFAYGRPLRRALARGNLLRAVGDEQRSAIPLHRVGRWRRSVGASALRRLPAAIAANARRGRSRAATLREIPGISVLDELPATTGTWPFLMVVADSAHLRDRILARLWGGGLGVSRLFIHDLTGYRYLEAIVARTAVPNARALAERSFTISNSDYLSDEGFHRIREIIRSVADHRRATPR